MPTVFCPPFVTRISPLVPRFARGGLRPESPASHETATTLGAASGQRAGRAASALGRAAVVLALGAVLAPARAPRADQDGPAQATSAAASADAQGTVSAAEEMVAAPKLLPFDEEPYRIRAVFSFSGDALSSRLREAVLRRFRSHAAAFVGDAWQVETRDASAELDALSAAAIESLDDARVGPYAEGQDKLFVFGVRAAGDRFILAAREFDTALGRWGPVFQGTAREPAQIARELLLLAARMFSPLAQVDSGDARRLTIRVKAGRLPALDPAAVDPRARYPVALQFIDKGTLFRGVRTVLNEEGEVTGIRPIAWTFYETDHQQGSLVTCNVISALTSSIPALPRDANEVQLIAARTAGGSTELRVVYDADQSPLAAMDVEVLTDRRSGVSLPLGTTDLDGRIAIPSSRQGPGLVTVFVRHGRDTMARVPVLPGAGEEPDLAIHPDAVRLDIEGRVVAVQEQIIDEVARRKIFEMQIKKAIEKKLWKEGDQMLKMLKASPSHDAVMAKLADARKYAARLRGDKPQTPKVLRMFSETEDIIEAYLKQDEFDELVENLEDELKSEQEAAQLAAGEDQAKPDAAPAGQPAPAPKS